ncbi:MAG: DMT family transporter [Patescibacteria group bacterium]
MAWEINALISSILFSLNSILGRSLAVKSEDPRAFAFVYNAIAAGFALVFLVFEQTKFTPLPMWVIILSALNMVTYGIFNRYEFFARKYVEASTYTILTKFIPIVTFTIAILFLGESLTFPKIIAAFLIVGGNILAVFKGRKLAVQKGIKYALIVILSLGVAWSFDKRLSSFYPLAFYAFLTYAIPNVFLYLFPRLAVKGLLKEVKISNWKIILLAFVNVSAYYFLIKAFSYGEASRVVLITSTSTILTVVIGIVFLKERSNVVRKVIAALLVTIGALLLK